MNNIKYAPHIDLYHGTSSESAIKILLSDGIKPKSLSNCSNAVITTTTKQNNMVYLTRKKDSAVSYGYNRMDQRGWTIKNGKLLLPVVFTIDIDTESDPLFIDEDYLADDIGKSNWNKFLLKNNIIHNANEARNWVYYYEHNPELANKIIKAFPWEYSLFYSGSITFNGIISLNKIKCIDIYYTPSQYKRVESTNIHDFLDVYNECCRLILNKYYKQYKDEYQDTEGLPNPYYYELLKYKVNKLDMVIYKNINLTTLNKLNELCQKYDYASFDKIIISNYGVYYMQTLTYLNHINEMDKFLDTLKYIILDIDDNNVSIVYFTYTRNNIGLILKNKDIIDSVIGNKQIIFEKKYYSLKLFDSKSEFWKYINKIINREIIIPAKKRI